MSDIVLNPVNVNDELTKALQAAISPEEIRAAVLAEAQKQTDASNAQKLTEQVAADAAKKQAEAKAEAEKPTPTFKRTELIGGREFEFEAPSELELERTINTALRVAYSVQEKPETKTETVDPAVVAAAAQKAAEDEAARRSDLELKFKRGDISAADYIEQSGAVDDYLTKKGIPLNKLQDVVNKTQTADFAQEWETATKTFLSQSDWPGGDRNKALIGMKIAELGLVEADDKVAALSVAYAALKKDKMLFAAEDSGIVAPPRVETKQPVTETPVVQTETKQPVAETKKPQTSSSLFDQSSGALSNSGAPKGVAEDQKIEIPANATPAEIMAAWTRQQSAQGRDPNAAFTEAFAVKR